MSDFVLYNYFRSSTSYRVRIALHYKSLKFEYKPVHLLNNGGEQHSAEYRELNPIGGVPTLAHKGKVISESRAIIDYLEEVHPEKPLYPKDPFLRAKVRQVCDTINTALHPLMNLRVVQYLEKKLHITTEQKDEWFQSWSKEGLKAVEKILSEFSKEYCFGNEVTTADLFLIPQLFSAQRFNVDLTPYTNLKKINENCLKLDCFLKAHPYQQMDTPEDLRIT